MKGAVPWFRSRGGLQRGGDGLVRVMGNSRVRVQPRLVGIEVTHARGELSFQELGRLTCDSRRSDRQPSSPRGV